MEEGEDQQLQQSGKKAKLHPPMADGMEKSLSGTTKRKRDEDEAGESSPTKKRRINSDSFMVSGPCMSVWRLLATCLYYILFMHVCVMTVSSV